MMRKRSGCMDPGIYDVIQMLDERLSEKSDWLIRTFGKTDGLLASVKSLPDYA